MSHSTRSSGAHGPWLSDDDLATMEGSFTGPALGDASPAGSLTVDGLQAEADVVNVWEVANLVGRGPTLSPAFATNTKHNRP